MKKKKIKYFIYDFYNNINTKQVIIKEFEFNDNTLILDFYKELSKQYLDIYKDICNNPYLVSFVVQNPPYYFKINYCTQNLYMDELLYIEDIIYCITPCLPIGGTLAIYRNIKLVMHTNENNHLRFPHIHIETPNGDTYINIKTNEINDNILSKNEKKKIDEYINNHKKELLDMYDDIINHRHIGKIEIDFIEN